VIYSFYLLLLILYNKSTKVADVISFLLIILYICINLRDKHNYHTLHVYTYYISLVRLMSASLSLIRAPRNGLGLIFSRRSACQAIRYFATVHTRDRILHNAWFNGTPAVYMPGSFPGGDPQKPSDPRTVKLGNSS